MTSAGTDHNFSRLTHHHSRRRGHTAIGRLCISHCRSGIPTPSTRDTATLRVTSKADNITGNIDCAMDECLPTDTGGSQWERACLKYFQFFNNDKSLSKGAKARHKRHTINGPLCGTTQVSWYQKGKSKQETVSGSGISWAVCKSAPCSRQITTPAPHHSVFLQALCPFCRPTNSVKAL